MLGESPTFGQSEVKGVNENANDNAITKVKRSPILVKKDVDKEEEIEKGNKTPKVVRFTEKKKKFKTNKKVFQVEGDLVNDFRDFSFSKSKVKKNHSSEEEDE